MKLFVTKRKEEDIERKGYKQAIHDLLLIRDKIFIGEMESVGANQTISNCAFLVPQNSYGLKIVGKGEDTNVKDCLFIADTN